MQRNLLIAPLILLLLGLTGCVTPQQMRDRRIAKSWSVFSTYGPEIQAQIRQGQIEVGFTEEMVRMALGSPDRIYSRRTADGMGTVWSYTGWIPSTRYEVVSVPRWIREDCGEYRSTYETIGVTIDDSREYERIRIEFRKQKVLAIESLQP